MKAVIFDLDGTLVHSAPDLHAAANVMLRKLGRQDVSLDQVVSFIGNGVPKLVERCLAATGGPDDQALAIFSKAYAEDLTTLTKPYPGVREALEQINLPMAICTNKPEAAARELCRDLTLDFEVLIGGDSLDVRKPNKKPLLAARTALGVEPSDCLYVGDSVVDFQTAQAAEVQFAFFSGGYQLSPIDGLDPARCFENWDELIPRFLN